MGIGRAYLRLARAATGRFEVLAFWGGFHGKTGGVVGLLMMLAGAKV